MLSNLNRLFLIDDRANKTLSDLIKRRLLERRGISDSQATLMTSGT
jgi:hypothetical protein